MMQAVFRRVVIAAGCASIALGCSGVDSEAPYGSVYYGADWYYGEDWYPSIGDDISLPDRPDRPDRPLTPEHPIALPPNGSPPAASQLPSRAPSTPSFAAPRPSIPSTPRVAPRGGSGGRGGGGRRR